MASQKKPAPPGQRFVGRWAIYSILGVPQVSLDSWRLRVFGLVERELSLGYEQLAATAVKFVRDFHCVEGWSVADVEWEGVRIRDLAEAAGVRPEARWVMFHCADGYTATVPVEDALAEDAIVALKMNGKPLSAKQGFPARSFIPSLYGWKSAKWLTGIEFMRNYVDGYWELHGYHERGNVYAEERYKGQSRVESSRRPASERANV